MSNKIAEILEHHKIVILDGGLATEVQNRGFDLNSDLWSAKILLENPEVIEQVHYEYFKAGADIGISASYQASVEGFRNHGYDAEKAKELIQLSVKLVQQARDRAWAELSEAEKAARPYPVVAGSVGPYAAFFADGSEGKPYADTVTKEDFIQYHRPRIQWLIEAGAEILAAETLPSLQEAEAILEILKDYPDVYAWFSFNAHDYEKISQGTSVAECAKALESYEQVAAVGVNCVPPKYVTKLIAKIAANTTKPVSIYPNGGLEFDVETKEWHHTHEEFDGLGLSFGDSTKDWYTLGARVIGGCCNTKPEDIEAIAAWAREK